MSPNGPDPDFKNTPVALGRIWERLITIDGKVSDLPCKRHAMLLDKLKLADAIRKAVGNDSAKVEEAKTGRLKMVLDHGWKVALLFASLAWGANNVGTARARLNGKAPTPRVRTSTQP